MLIKSRFFIASFILLVIDQCFKYWISISPIRVGDFSFYNLVGIGYYLNTNFSWSWPLSNYISAMLSLILLIGLIIFYKRNHKYNINPALLLIIAGALSNLFDRLWRGGVVDYIWLPMGGIINLADVIIIVGVVWILLKTKSSRIHVS